MPEVTKSDADRKLIEKIFSITPISWARHDDGRLAFISPTGQKFVYTEEMLRLIQEDMAKDAAASRPAAKKQAAAPADPAPVEPQEQPED